MRRNIICIERDDRGRIIRVNTRHTDQLGEIQNQTWPAEEIFHRQDEIEFVQDLNGNQVNTGRFDFYARTTFASGSLWVRAIQDEDDTFFVREDIGDEGRPAVEIIAPLCSE